MTEKYLGKIRYGKHQEGPKEFKTLRRMSHTETKESITPKQTKTEPKLT